MAERTLSHDELRETLAAMSRFGSQVKAAEALSITRSALQNRLRRASLAGMAPLPPADFEIAELPDELPTADELLDRRRKQFAKKAAAKDARDLVPVKIKLDGPYGLFLAGDPHVDDDGTDIALLEQHLAIVNRTEGMLAGNVGDYSNNWVGRLARLYGQQSTSAKEAWVLVEWLVTAAPWLFLIGGNHDLWSGDGDPVKWMAKSARVAYEANGMRLALTSPSGRVIRLNARHDFSGRSQWNTAHGPAKAAQLGWRDHLLVCGHTHVSGYQVLRDPSSGLISHAVRIGSYKTYDRYAEEKGLPNQQISAAVVAVVQPDRADDDAGLLTVFHDVETAASFLTFLRKRKSTRGA